VSFDSLNKDWENGPLGKTLNKFPERQTTFTTPSGSEIKRLYTPADSDVGTDVAAYSDRIGFPGEYPYTRGVQPTMFRGKLWTMRQYAGFGSAQESNRRYRYLLENGQTGLSVAFDLPTQIGMDSDNPMALGEVGKVGVAIDTLADMEILFDQIPLDQVTTSMTINAPAMVLLAMYITVAGKRGISPAELGGTIQNDILKEYVARGTYIYPPRQSMRLITDIFAYCCDHVPQWNTISISGYHLREAGCTAAQEVAFTLADGIAYVDAAIATGMDVDAFASRLSFFFNVHNNFIEEVAKFRAARRIWAKIMRERFAAKSPKSWMLRFHTQTAGSTLTAQQPENNAIRVAIQTLAAVMGGTQSLHTNSRDEALGLPTEDSVRLALRTQQIVGYESGAADTIDPLGGSWAVEAETDRIEAEALAYIAEIDRLGGMVPAIEKGFVQKQVQDAAYRYGQEVDNHVRQIVGVNCFTMENEVEPAILEIDPETEASQIEALGKIKRNRDNVAVAAALKAVEAAAISGDNLFPAVIEAVAVYASLGEISDVLRVIFGEYREEVVL
jgi:methylmalonyl-CoA mutase N-terminal domain/subunit